MATETDPILQRLRDGYEAFNRGDFDGVVELMDPDIVWNRVPNALDDQPVLGRDAVKAFLAPDVFAEQHVEVEDVIRHGDRILVTANFHVRARMSGIEFNGRGFHVWTMRDQLATSVEFHNEREDALRAVGL
jgi:ketosteroid isomerase-like protein